MWLEKTTPNSSRTASSCHGGSTCSTSCPSEPSSSAASVTARAASGSTIASGTGASVVIAIRSLPGDASADAANGSLGAGAQVASPGS
jgi:hypothetical protein